MHLPTRETWLELAKHDGQPCVTLAIPREGDDPLGLIAQRRLKHAVEEADGRLERQGVPRERRETILQPARDHLVDQGLSIQGCTLLFLLSEDRTETWDLGPALPHRVEVSDHFVLSDLIAAREEPERWLALTLTDDGARLLLFHAGNPSQLDLPLEREDRASTNAERQQPNPRGDRHAHRTSGAGSRGTRVSTQGFGDEHVDDIERRAWHRQVADALAQVLPDPRIPLLLVADPVHLGSLKELLERYDLQTVARNPADLGDADLHALGQASLGADEVAPTESEHRAWSSAERTTRDLKEALAGARVGRVSMVFWDPDATVRTLRDGEAPEGAPDLVDELVRQTAVHGGEAVPVPTARLPGSGSSPIAAALRW